MGGRLVVAAGWALRRELHGVDLTALLRASTPIARVAFVAALLPFRVVHYFVPLLIAGVVAAVVELRADRHPRRPVHVVLAPVASGC